MACREGGFSPVPWHDSKRGGCHDDQRLQRIRAAVGHRYRGRQSRGCGPDRAAKQPREGIEADVYTFTPAQCALIFIGHNSHNREWRPATSKEFARLMSTKQWLLNTASAGFYPDGQMSDCQHRMAAAALAGFTFTVIVGFGMKKEAIVTVDVGARRHASDALKLEGVKDARRKQTIMRLYAAYKLKQGTAGTALKSESEMAAAIKADNDLLNLAMELGERSGQNIVNPVLKPVQADASAFIMLKSGWPAARATERLALFQTGVDTSGEKTPFFVTNEFIAKARNKRDRGERLSMLKELGVVMFAMCAAERGVMAIQPGTIHAAIKKGLPDPTWPGDPEPTRSMHADTSAAVVAPDAQPQPEPVA